MKSLILAQDERWQCALHMQVERISLFVAIQTEESSGKRVSNGQVIYHNDWDTPLKKGSIPDNVSLNTFKLKKDGLKLSHYDEPISYQLVGEAMAHQGYDGQLV